MIRREFLESLSVLAPINIRKRTTANEEWSMYANNQYNTGYNIEGVSIGKKNIKKNNYIKGKKISTTPIVDGNTIYVGTDGGVFLSINSNTGETRWTHQTSGSIWSSPALSDGTLYFGDNTGNFYAIDNGGEHKWTFSTDAKIHSSPVVKQGIAYFVSYDGNLYAVSSGSEVWKAPVGGSTGSSPALSGDRLIVGSGFQKGHVRAISTSGKQIWDRKFDNGFGSSPTIHNNRVYIGGYDGNLYCLNLKSGETVWKFSTGSSIASSPSIGNHVVVFGNDSGSVYGVNAKTGEEIWSHDLDEGKVWNSPALTDSAAYVGSDRAIAAFDLHYGDEFWALEHGTGFASPSVTNNSLYVPSHGLYEIFDKMKVSNSEKTEEDSTTTPGGGTVTILGIPFQINLSIGIVALISAIAGLLGWSKKDN
jgi:outer membrane protein assembly factor BamB